MHANGSLLNVGVTNLAVAARPACFLNLESIIFKSASEDFDLGSGSPSAEGGSRENPYVLVLPGEVPAYWSSGKFLSEDHVPDSMDINGKTLTMMWSSTLPLPAVKRWPDPADFTLWVGSRSEHPTAITSDDANLNVLKLTFAAGVTANDKNLRLSYNLNTDAILFAVSGWGANRHVANSFENVTVTNVTPIDPIDPPVTPNVTPSHTRFDGSSPADVKALLRGAALTAAKAGYLSITDSTPDGTRIPLGAGDYSVESRNLTIFISFLSKLGDGTHTLYFYNGDVQVGKITLTVTGSTGGEAKDSGSSGCNAGLGSAGLLAMGMMLLGLNKAGARKKK